MQTDSIYLIDLLLFSPLALYVTWPKRVEEFGSPLVILVLLLAWAMVWVARAAKYPELHALLKRRLIGLLIVSGSCYIISWSILIANYLASRTPSISDNCYSVAHLLDHLYSGLLWLIFPWLGWMAFLVLVKLAKQQTH